MSVDIDSEPPSAVGVDGRPAWGAAVAAAVGLFASAPSIWLFTSGIFLLPVSTELRLSRGQVGAAFAVFPLCIALSAPGVGWLVDRFGGRLVATLSVPLFALALALISVAPVGYSGFVTTIALAGILSAGQTAIPYSRVVSGWFDRHRGIALAVALTGVGLGAAFFPPFAERVIAYHGWRSAFLAMAGIVAIVTFPAVAILLRNPPRPTLQPPVDSLQPGGVGFRSKPFWLMAVAFLLVGCAMAGTSAHLPSLLHDRHFEGPQAARLLSAMGIALIAGRLIAGGLIDRFHAGLVGSCFFTAAAAGLMLIATGTDLRVILAGTILVGLATGAEYDLLAFLVSRYFSIQKFGATFGCLTLIFSLGAALGPAFVGILYEDGLGYHVALLALAIGLLLAAGSLALLGRYPNPREYFS